ncbi:MAG TPA: cupredoxin domain-containing protein [Nitrososphaeraceae archaeon]|nr:cupredoxin domain-containing protein [Nitrososphaeraceae archaeon]
MGSAGKTAFIAILALGAITGIVMYYLFEAFSMPTPGIVNSGLRSELTEIPSKEGSSNIMDEDTATETTTATEGSGGGANATVGTPAATTTTTAAAATLTIPMGSATPGNPAYEPASLTVKKGDVIDVVNEDSVPHTVTSGTGLEDPNAGKMFDTSIINAAASAQLATTDLEAGEYDYHCAVHPFMTGKIIVQ